MMIAIVGNLKFHSSPETHTVEYDTNAKKAAFNEPQFGNFKAVLVKTRDEAHEKLSVQLRAYLDGWWNLDPKDFTFEIKTTDVDEAGEFWLLPKITSGSDWKIL